MSFAPSDLFSDPVLPPSGAARGPDFELPKARMKLLQTLGHKVLRFLEARQAWWQAHQKGGSAALPPWASSSAEPASLDGSDGWFASLVGLGPRGLALLRTVVDRETALPLASLWQKLDPEAPAELHAALDLPPDADATRWRVLLRLRMLRTFWESQLRRDTLDALLEWLPDAWALDPTPLPPGAVIPRLEIAAWPELPSHRPPGMAFCIRALDSSSGGAILGPGESEAAFRHALQEALASTSPALALQSLPGDAAEHGLIVVFHSRRDGRTGLLGALALRSTVDGITPARVVPERR